MAVAASVARRGQWEPLKFGAGGPRCYSDCCFCGFTVALVSALAEQPSPSATFRSCSLSSTSFALACALASALHLPFLLPVTLTELDADEDAEAEEEDEPVDCALSTIWLRRGSGASLGFRLGAGG